MKDCAQPFKGHVDRLVERSLRVNAMHDINWVFFHAILYYAKRLVSLPAIWPEHQRR